MHRSVNVKNTTIFFKQQQWRTDGVHCRESTGTGPEVPKVVPVTGAVLASPWINYVRLFCLTHYWYEVGMLKAHRCCISSTIKSTVVPGTVLYSRAVQIFVLVRV